MTLTRAGVDPPTGRHRGRRSYARPALPRMLDRRSPRGGWIVASAGFQTSAGQAGTARRRAPSPRRADLDAILFCDGRCRDIPAPLPGRALALFGPARPLESRWHFRLPPRSHFPKEFLLDFIEPDKRARRISALPGADRTPSAIPRDPRVGQRRTVVRASIEATSRSLESPHLLPSPRTKKGTPA